MGECLLHMLSSLSIWREEGDVFEVMSELHENGNLSRVTNAFVDMSSRLVNYNIQDTHNNTM